jgi:hypothetical protein
MNYLKFHPGPACPTLLLPAGWQPAPVFYPLGHPTPFAYDDNSGLNPLYLILLTVEMNKKHDF